MSENWLKQKAFTLKKGLFTIHYDTAEELGKAAAEIWHHHGELIENPYEPDFLEYDEFNEAKSETLNSYKDLT